MSSPNASMWRWHASSFLDRAASIRSTPAASSSDTNRTIEPTAGLSKCDRASSVASQRTCPISNPRSERTTTSIERRKLASCRAVITPSVRMVPYRTMYFGKGLFRHLRCLGYSGNQSFDGSSLEAAAGVGAAAGEAAEGIAGAIP